MLISFHDFGILKQLFISTLFPTKVHSGPARFVTNIETAGNDYIEYISKLKYETVADVPESWVWLRADFQSGSGVLNLFLSISMAYNVISCQKVAENTHILKMVLEC